MPAGDVLVPLKQDLSLKLCLSPKPCLSSAALQLSPALPFPPLLPKDASTEFNEGEDVEPLPGQQLQPLPLLTSEIPGTTKSSFPALPALFHARIGEHPGASSVLGRGSWKGQKILLPKLPGMTATPGMPGHHQIHLALASLENLKQHLKD